ncbi:hypothetical protein LEP1GSC036_2135 [Leptospira weilii str. 2006001853]|uniref:Uncharacterized protein n=4 Tax=Leptospira weilii TaxID=28184 RepID=A0A828YXZ4_9LEPT|nr:hypothetical protein LEP1GSC036_2135 [Leptospira weilii str. 2006001853]EMJ60282.1 hypothetical protein LEP1GSC051_0283 [Leptospira sp. P2653]EMM72622.1 hypothetical protein LEP1GSC038_2052 [Leptospira weilii str. 2006001855]EMN43885.1 hypothetical protein LEP1GSC086_4422 [Leptospira weilii str. LNT 1234]EMN91426.1 hypothetical protein LEP1GSC108_0945 [Leptospira weilii str. UI 13098]EMY16347.1 hypothetical protein LEP1GSC043_0445 [Leptospira weilii str. Ecochallenge]
MYFVKKFNSVESTPPVRITVSKKDSRVRQEEWTAQQTHTDKMAILFDINTLDF